MSDLTLIIPAKNEKESLPKVLDELGKFKFKKYYTGKFRSPNDQCYKKIRL